MKMYYDKYGALVKQERKHIRTLLCWLSAHCPNHRLFDSRHIAWAVFLRGIEGLRSSSRVKDFRTGAAWTPNVYRGVLDHYVKLGWPEYCLMVTSDDEVYIFKKEHLEGVLDVVNNSEMGEEATIRTTGSGD